MKPGSMIVSALEDIWAGIQVRRSTVPDVVITLQNRDGGVLGSFQAEQWNVNGETGRRPEIVMATEYLNRTPSEIMATILHEAAHGSCHAQGIQDTSRQGRYHNKRFASEAETLGLTVSPQGNRGLAHTAIKPETEEEYAYAIAYLTHAICAWKDGDLALTELKPPTVPKPKAECECGRQLAVSQRFLEGGDILCGECSTPFRFPDEED